MVHSLQHFCLKPIRRALSPWVVPFLTKSLKLALSEQNFDSLYETLSGINPDLYAQYSTTNLDNPYIIRKVRSLHCFQVALTKKAIEWVKERKSTIKIADIGDSAGTHTVYLKTILDKVDIDSIGVNLDENAVNKIRERGLPAICCRAEELIAKHQIAPDIFMSFETIEHLPNPVQFMHAISQGTQCDYFVITVPYLEQSRVGLHHIRQGTMALLNAEDVHYFELCPNDWKLLFQHSGWEVVEEQIYWQYPKKHLLRALFRFQWKRSDYEGFYGVILKRNPKWSRLYQSW